MSTQRKATQQMSGNAAGSANSALRAFLQASVFDFILVLVLSTGLAFTVSYGFYGAEGLRDNFLLEAAIAAPLLVALFAGSWSKRALLPSAIAAVIIAGIIIGTCAALQPAGTAFVNGTTLNDVPENYVIWGLVVIVCALLSFLLSRRPVTMVILAVVAVVACASVQFLYRDWLTMHSGFQAAAVVIFCVVALFVYQRYRLTALKGSGVSSLAFGGAFVFSLVISGICVCLASALYFALIASLGLSTPVIKPFQDYYMRPVVEYSAPISKQQVENPDNTSSNTNNNQQDTNQNTQGGVTSTPSQQDAQIQSQGSTSKELSAYDDAQQDERYEQIGYLLVHTVLPIVLIVVLLLLIVLVLLRRSWRERRIRKLEGLSNAAKVIFIYDYLVKCFSKLKIEYPPTLTPLEFAFASLDALQPYSHNAASMNFVQLTLIYQRAKYGAKEITQEELDDVLAYYRAFYGNARKRLGWRKWFFFMFWRV